MEGDEVQILAQHAGLHDRAKSALGEGWETQNLWGVVQNRNGRNMLYVSWKVGRSWFTTLVPSHLVTILHLEPEMDSPDDADIDAESDPPSASPANPDNEPDEPDDEIDQDDGGLIVGKLVKRRWIKGSVLSDDCPFKNADYRAVCRWGQGLNFSDNNIMDIFLFVLQKKVQYNDNSQKSIMDLLLARCSKIDVTFDELVIFMILKLLIALHKPRKGTTIRELFDSNEPDPLDIFYQPQLARFGMTAYRFEDINGVICGPCNKDNFYGESIELLELITAITRQIVVPSKFLVFDESMGMYHGLETSKEDWEEGRIMHGAGPPLDRMENKPIGVGTFIYTASAQICPGMPTVLTHAEIRRSDLPCSNLIQEYINKLPKQKIGKTALAVLKGMEPYFGSNRVVIVDGLYGSCELAVALRYFGLFMVGCIKTCTAGFPLASLKEEAKDLSRGQSVYLLSPISMTDWQGNQISFNLIATIWKKSQRKCFSFVSTCGTTSDGTPISKDYPHIEGTYQHRLNRSTIVEMYHNFMSFVDKHNKTRQDLFGIEHAFRTPHWLRRMFDTSLGMLFTNIYALNCWEQRENPDYNPSASAFVRRLAVAILVSRTSYGQSLQASRRRQRPRDFASPQPKRHKTETLSTHPYIQERIESGLIKSANNARGRCCRCQKKTSHYCAECSTQTESGWEFVYLCSQKECATTHASETSQ